MKNFTVTLLFLIGTLNITNAQWQQVGIDIVGEASYDHSGAAISLSSDGLIMAIGAYGNGGNGYHSGHVRIYKNQNGDWTQIGSDINGVVADELIGHSVSLSLDGSIVVIGGIGIAVNGELAGGARIYENQNGDWTQIGSDILGSASQDIFGWSVSISSDGFIVAIGSRRGGESGNNSGYVRIYENQNGDWIQMGSEINGISAVEDFGWFTCLNTDGSIVAIGAPDGDQNGANSGYVRIYENQNEVWTQIGSDIIGEETGDRFGRGLSLSSDGSIVAIGAPGYGIGSLGHVRVYENQNEIWTQAGLDIVGEVGGAGFGESVSISSDGSIVAVGAYMNSDNGEDMGQVCVYEFQNGMWTQIGLDINGEADGDLFGKSISLSSDGSIIAVGASQSYCNAPGLARVYENLSVGIVEENNNKLNIYPNPTNNFVVIKNDEFKIINGNITDFTGKVVKSFKIQDSEQQIDISNLKSGIYFVKVTTANGVAAQKLILE